MNIFKRLSIKLSGRGFLMWLAVLIIFLIKGSLNPEEKEIISELGININPITTKTFLVFTGAMYGISKIVNLFSPLLTKILENIKKKIDK